ncbi:TPA: hypothetical protein ACG5VZ_002445 [Escherichia coli]
MIRIEILFDRQSTKNLKSGTLQALQNEIRVGSLAAAACHGLKLPL